MDLAQSWADPRVLHCVQSKWDSLPPVKEKGKGKGGKGGAKSGGKRPASVPPGEGGTGPPGTAKVGTSFFLSLNLPYYAFSFVLHQGNMLAVCCHPSHSCSKSSVFCKISAVTEDIPSNLHKFLLF